MNFFQPIVENPNASAAVLTKKKVPWNWGLKLPPITKEARAKASATLKGRIISEETRAKISAANKGKFMSEETRAKISATKLNSQIISGTAKPLMTPNGLYPSRKAVVEAAGVTPYEVNCWIKKWPQHYFYLD